MTYPQAVFAVLLCTAATSLGQILVKLGLDRVIAGGIDTGDRLRFLVNVFLSPLVIAGLACAVIAAASYLLALTRLPISYAYPFVALTFPTVLVGSAMIFGDQIPMMRWLGVVVIVFGVVLVARS